ncbi:MULTISPECIES: aldo/keto reductase [unclassified Haladaptatus]|uniref:aldo/keto reductase n=1 Tax=unclassified Haladaptatus TaxID=2622732 RepID=UPI00209C5A79|nr:MULTISPECIES: aldo/keto reductase [unclassified Haladaptatus]MCO8245404.1 aldo/keto reductase [Haladaptatus sp. AB643]MCO8256837.1 aldo/keto reductase [Haladaptatus sp. AB618]
METRPLGEIGHDSSILTFGAIALNFLEQDEANQMVEDVLNAGVNHFDVAPTYGDAEVKLAPKLNEHRDEIFLGCKTQERTYYGAWGELHKSLERLDTDYIDLYQFHALTRYDELDTVTGNYHPEMSQGDHDPGALEAFKEAKEEGLIGHIGLTSHGDPSIIRTSIKRIPELESVMFPFNYTLDSKKGPEYDYRSVLEFAQERGLGTLCIKGFAKQSWPEDLSEDERPYSTWYEPYDTKEELVDCFRYALSQGMTTIPSAGDPNLVPDILEAANEYEPLDEAEQERLREAGRDHESPVPAP